MIRRDAFVRHVRDALANLYDPIHLQRHPLADLLKPACKPGETSGQALRSLLWQTIETLRPPESVPVNRPEWLSYRLLWLYYVQSAGQEATCQELGLSPRSFYRRLQQALEAVADILWASYEDSARPSAAPAQPTLSPDERATEEAVRLARQAPRQPVSLAGALAVAQETVQPLLRQQGLTLVVEAPPSLPTVHADPAVLHQIILNVLTEAIDLASAATLHLSVSTVDGGTLWRLSGLNVKQAAEREAGERPGLAVSQNLLGVYGGRLWLERGEGGALTLLFSLPGANPATIVIIDDSPDTIELYSRYLQAQQYTVRVARSEQELTALLAETRPDLILLDVLMPQTDGWNILQRLKLLPETRDIPVVICSVLSQPRLALALGAAAVLRKPIDEATLLETVQQVLAPPGSSA